MESVEIDRYIYKNYKKQMLKDMAAHLGIKYVLIQQRADKLVKKGLLNRRDRLYQPLWTRKEIDYLIVRFGLVSDAIICRRLRRSPVGMRLKAKRLGLRKKMNMFTRRDCARMFGVDDHEVGRWIDEGRLKARQAPFKQGGGQVWIITVEAVEKFIRNNPAEYDIERIDMDEWPWVHRLAIQYGFRNCRMRGSHYSREEEQYIINNYARMSPASVAEKLGRPVRSVAGKAQSLRAAGHPVGNRKGHIKHRNAWTESQDRYLISNYGTQEVGEISQALKRTEGACARRISLLRQKNRVAHATTYLEREKAA